MKTKELQRTESTTQKFQLVKGAFTPSEAAHVVMSLIDEKINFHKVQKLQLWEGNHKCQTGPLDGRIAELEQEKKAAAAFIEKTRKLGQSLEIDGILKITAYQK
jgi:hypothetical protein